MNTPLKVMEWEGIMWMHVRAVLESRPCDGCDGQSNADHKYAGMNEAGNVMAAYWCSDCIEHCSAYQAQ